MKKKTKKILIISAVILAVLIPVVYTIATARMADHLTLLAEEWEAGFNEYVKNGGAPVLFISKTDFIDGVLKGDIVRW